MKVLNLLAVGGTGGIEVLCRSIALRSNIDNTFWFLFEEGEIYEELKQMKAKVISTKNKNRNIRKIVKELESYCIKENIDIVVVHHGGLACNIIYTLLRKRCKKVKFVRFLHGCYDKYLFGNNSNKINNYVIKFFMKKALDASDLIIYVSKAVKKSFHKSFNINNVKEAVVYNGIDENFLKTKFKEKTNINKRKCKIIYVGRLVKLKGVDILINAIKKLKEERYNVKLTIVGDGEERKSLENLSTQLKLGEAIEFVGRQKNVIKWLDESDIFVYPSICEEAFGISVAEAMARKCIPIVSNHGGLPEVVDDKKTGYVVKKLDSKNLAQVIKECIDKEITGKGIKKEEIRKKAEQFTIDKTIEKLNVEYKKLIKSTVQE